MNALLIADSHIIGHWGNIPLLGRLTGPDAFTLAAARAPGFLPATLFETHFTWWAIAVGMAVLLIYLSHARQQRALLPIGAVLLVLSIAWIIAAWVCDTPAERLYKAHQTLADAAQRGDVDTIMSYLAPDITISASEVSMNSSNKQEISDVLKKYGIKDTKITSYTSHLDADGSATSQITVITQMNVEGMSGPVPTGWLLRWNDMPEQDWKIVHAQYVQASIGPVSGPPAAR